MDGCQYSPEIPNINKDDGSGQASDRSRTVEPETIERPDNDSASTSGSSGNCSLGSFEIIPKDCIPEPGSEELLVLNNAPISVTGTISDYVARCWEAPMRVEMTNGIWSYIDAFFHDAFSYVDNEEVDKILHEFLNEISSFADELRQRDCLVQALYDHCKEIIDAVLVNSIGVALLSFLERRGCINQTESLYLKGKQEDPVAVTRLLFSMMLDRDLKTLFTFVWALRYVSNELFENVILQFNAYMKSSTSAMVLQCLRCILIDRVDIHLVADYLLRCRSCNMKKLYNKIILAQRAESEAIWKELFERVKLKPSLYTEVQGVIMEAMENCGFHSDILKRLQADNNQETDFDCRCNEAGACSIGTEQTYQVTCCNSRMLKCGAVRTADRPLEDTNRSIISASTVTHTEHNHVSSENAESEGCMDESNLQRADASEKVNSEDVVCKSNSLKRKNSENEDYRKKKSSNFSDDHTCHYEMQANCEKKS